MSDPYKGKKKKIEDVPTPEMEFAEYTFKTTICIDKSPTESKEVKEIAKWITALMNTSGGLILLYCSIPDSDKARDKWIMGFESLLMNNWIPESLLQDLVRYQYLETDNQLRIYVFVCKSASLVTFDFHAFTRLTTGVRSIGYQKVQKLLNDSHISASERECRSQLENIPQKGNTFTIDDPIPATHRESETMEFKHCYVQDPTEESKKTELPLFTADILKQRLGEHMKYLCAFANTQGGSLVLGVKEGGNFPVVRGFPVALNQEAEENEIAKYLMGRLCQCIWHGDPEYTPEIGKDWNVFYHKIIQFVGKERKMIEVRITQHSGGMFLHSPVYYIVDGNGKVDEKQNFSDWKGKFHTTKPVSNTEWTDTPSVVQKHVQQQRTGTDINDQDEHILNEPEDKSEFVTEDNAAETTLPKSFRESQSKHKSDILVQGLSMHDCCTNKMAQHVKTLKGDKIWYPSIEHIRGRFPVDACSDKLITFLQEKKWNGLASVIDIKQESCTTKMPRGHSLICSMLILSEHKPPLLMSCITSKYQSQVTEQGKDTLVSYALDSGRALKRHFLMGRANWPHECLFHFDIEVLLVPTEGDVRTVWCSRENQPVTYPSGNQEHQYTIACNGLAEDLLRTRAMVKDRYGQILIEHLTEAQVRVLHGERKRVLIVTGKSGTGKTVIALNLAKEAIKEGSGQPDVVYICSSEGLKSFVQSQISYPVISVQKTICLSQLENVLEEARLIIVDDVHAIELDEDWESNPGDLYLMLFTRAAKTKTRVAVFFDPEQDYKEHLPKDFDKRLRSLAETVHGMSPQDIKIVELKERIRNSQELNRFMQANQNQANVTGKIECLNERPGDDVIYQYIGSNVEESAKIMNAKLGALEAKYGARSIAIVCDDHEQMGEMKRVLIDQFNRYFQDEHEYPIQHTVICCIADFGGLEAEVILFLLPRNFGTENSKLNWKYINVISSRARERLEFLLPWQPESEKEEQQGSLTKLLELFKIPPIDYGGLVVTGKRKIQAGYMLTGLCYSEGRLYTLEMRLIETGRYSYDFAVYSVHRDSGDVALLDRLELWETDVQWNVSPRVDRHSRRVFVPIESGVTVARLDDHRLVRQRTLTCVSVAVGVDVLPPDTICVCDGRNKSVHIVDVRNDRITSTLEKPDTTRDEDPARLAVLGDRVMVCYSGLGPLVVYRHGSPAPVRVIPHSLGMHNHVRDVSTDCQHHFLLLLTNGTLFALDMSGNILHTVNIDDNFKMGLVGYAVVDRQLWAAFNNGDIAIMSSR